MNAIAHSSKYARFHEKEKASLIIQIWHILMEKDFEHDVSINPVFRYVVIAVEKVGLPLVFCAFMGYLWMQMLAKYDGQQQLIFKMQQDNCIAITQMASNFKEMKEVILLTNKR
jgi:hypothetical protein